MGPHPLNIQNPIRMTKVFRDTLLSVISIYWGGQFLYSSLLAFSVHGFEQQTRYAGPLALLQIL